MSEPSEVPPFWSHRFLSHLIPSRLYDEVDNCNYSNENRTPVFRDTWHPKFEQPARDYVAFRRKLEESNVALENVVVMQKEDWSRFGGNECKDVTQAVGTVKVRNLDYHKDVVVRYTFDGWKTYKDETCSHVPTSASVKTGPSAAYHLHDTFRFELKLPTYISPLPSAPTRSANTGTKINSIVKNSHQGVDVTDCVPNFAKMIISEEKPRNKDGGEQMLVSCDRVEFCLRFVCAGGEYWDNNSGRNYVIQRRQHNVISTTKITDNSMNNSKVIDKVREATYASMQGSAWSEFVSWQHLENNCPYW